MSEISQHVAVAEEVRAVMGRRRVSKARLARELGWSPFYLGRRVNGQTPLDVNDLYALARALDVEPTQFFPEQDAGTVGSVRVGPESLNNDYVQRARPALMSDDRERGLALVGPKTEKDKDRKITQIAA